MKKRGKLCRSKSRLLGGVCGGIARYFGLDVSLVRLATICGAFLSLSLIFWVYLLLWIILPEQK